MKAFSAVKYYLESISTILYGFKDIPELIISGGSRVFLNNGFKFFVTKPMDVWALKEVILDDCYKVGDTSGKVAIDIGAGVGDFSIFFSDKFKTIYSYEPDKNTFNALSKNIKANTVRNILSFNKKANSLDEVFKVNKLRKCDLLKIDCEGDEYNIFRNTSDTVLKKVKHISMEVHFFNEKQKTEYLRLKTRLNNLEFKIEEKENPVHDYIGFLFADR